MSYSNTIMKKLIFIIFIISFPLNLMIGQSISDINSMKKQYEEYIKNQDKIIFDEDN